MDGTVAAAEKYTKARGSLVLTLKSAYLNTLTAGSFGSGSTSAFKQTGGRLFPALLLRPLL